MTGRNRRRPRQAGRWSGCVVLAVAVAACDGSPAVLGVDDGGGNELQCSIPQSLIFNGGPGKDGIPALTDPQTARPGQPGTEYLTDEDRVVGVQVGERSLAIPLNIFWWHEIVNLEADGVALAVTHCPLTGSSLAFDRAPLDGVEFGVSGLLYQNNLIMYDRSTAESLWPQMLRGARCGSSSGTDLVSYPVVEMSWGAWRSLHPQTEVVTSNTGYDRSYRLYPYGAYDEPDNPQLLFPGVTLDGRRPPKERVLGIPDAQAGIALPYGSLDELGPVAAVEVSAGADVAVVFWDREASGAMAYRPVLEGSRVTFTTSEGRIVDEGTGSVWGVHGWAVEGSLTGTRLEPVAEAYVAFWFAWAAFHPGTQLWSPQ